MTRWKTDDEYRRCGTQLIKRCSRDLDLPKGGTAGANDVVDWFLQLKPEIAKGTFRKYKASLIYIIFHLYGKEGLMAAERLKRESQTGALEKGIPPSFEKIKKLPPDDLCALVNWLSQKNSSYAAPLSNFLLSSVLTGLRPEEWTRAELFRDKKEDGTEEYVLNVENAKFDGQHYHGRTRILILTNFDDDSIGYILSFLKWRKDKFSRQGVKWIYLRRRLSQILCQANLALWPKRKKHYKLSSARDQAEINFKGSCAPVSVAALLGRSSLDITKRNKSNIHSEPPFLSGTKQVCLPEPHRLDVERIKRHLEKVASV